MIFVIRTMTSMPFVKSTVLCLKISFPKEKWSGEDKVISLLESEQKNLKVARPRLERIETDILNNFKVLGAQAHS